MKIQDASLRLTGTMATELPVISSFRMRASRGISREGTLFFGVPRYRRPAQDRRKCEAQVIFISRGADLGVNR